MLLGEKLKQLRKDKGYSQEKLAEILGVSRQAVTKWETDAGIPDIENIVSLAKIFGISTDELLLEENAMSKPAEHIHGSINEYDIDAAKHYDIHFGSARKVVITTADNEKIKVELISDKLSSVFEDFKLKIDDNRSDMDIDLFRKNGMTESAARENLDIFVYLPKKFILSFELSVNADSLELRDIKCDGIELDIKANNLTISRVESKIELNCNLNMNIVCETLENSLDINQLSACSKLYLPHNTDFFVSAKGKTNSISFEGNQDFSNANSEKIIELNGRKSELVIYRLN